MGRKIPAKKHRGVKDPVKQQEQRLKSLKDKIDAPPADPDEQPVPRSLLRLFDQRVKRAPRLPTERSKHRGVSAAPTRSPNPVSRLRRLPGEAARAFSLRINSAVRSLNHDQHDDYPMTLDENEDEDVKGAAISQRRERRARRRQRAGGQGAGAQGEGRERPSRAQALTLRKKAKREKQQQELSAQRAEVVYERVSFGEVAGAPPTLTARPRKALPPLAAPRPGQRDLLLHAVLAGAAPHAPRAAPLAAPPPRLRDLPSAERQRRERARLQAVQAYRMIKNRPSRALTAP